MDRRSFLTFAVSALALGGQAGPAFGKAAAPEAVIPLGHRVPKGLTTMLEAADQMLRRDEIKRAAFTEILAQQDVLQALPFMRVEGGAYAYWPEGGGSAEEDKVVRRLRCAGSDVDVDPLLADSRSLHEQIALRKVGLAAAERLVSDELNSLVVPQRRFFAGAKKPYITPSLVDKMIDGMAGATHLIMRKNQRNRLADQGALTWRKDQYGVRVAYYNDLPILINLTSYEDSVPAQTTQGDAVYAVRLGADGVVGLWNDAPQVDDLGEIDPTVLHLSEGVWAAITVSRADGSDWTMLRTRMEWLINLASMNTDAASMVWGLRA